jgi:hypothetical protein
MTSLILPPIFVHTVYALKNGVDGNNCATYFSTCGNPCKGHAYPDTRKIGYADTINTISAISRVLKKEPNKSPISTIDGNRSINRIVRAV